MKLSKDEIALNKIVGLRLRESRELCDYTQIEAAKMLGVTKVVLNKIESGCYQKAIPLKLIQLAAQSYDVTTDFLFSESDDFERANEVKAKRRFGVQMHSIHQKQLSKLAVKSATQDRKQKVLVKSMKSALYGITELDETLITFKKMNPSSDDMPCSSKLNHRINKLSKAAVQARLELVKSQAIPLNFLPNEINQ